jgi:glyoxylate reductase
MKPKVFLSQAQPEIVLETLREVAEVAVYPYMDQQITVAELAAYAKRSDWLFTAHETKVTAEVIYANPNLQGIGCMHIGDDLFIDMAAANARKLPVIIEDRKEIFPGVSPTTCDLTMAMLLGLAYRLVDSDRYTRHGNFRQEQTMALMGLGCPGKTVGLLGLGRVGRYMVPRCLAFDMNVIYTKRTRLLPEEEQALGVAWAGFDDLIRRSDFLCIACDYNQSTHKLIGKRELDLMKPQAYLLNTARGRIIDEPALIDALREKRIAGAGLDVYWNEPYSKDPSYPVGPWVPEELRKLDNVILAPHNGGATWDVRSRKALSVARGMVQMMRGARPAGLCNPQIYADA